MVPAARTHPRSARRSSPNSGASSEGPHAYAGGPSRELPAGGRHQVFVWGHRWVPSRETRPPAALLRAPRTDLQWGGAGPCMPLAPRSTSSRAGRRTTAPSCWPTPCPCVGNALVDGGRAGHRPRTSHPDRPPAADRGMGALEFRPRPAHRCRPPTACSSPTRARRPPDCARRSRRRRARPLDALEQLIQVGTSAGGARAGVVAYNPDCRCAPLRSRRGLRAWLLLTGWALRAGRAHRPPRRQRFYCRVDTLLGWLAQRAWDGRVPAAGRGPRRHFMTAGYPQGPAPPAHPLRHGPSDPNMVGAHSYDQYLQTVRALGLDGDALQQAYGAWCST